MRRILQTALIAAALVSCGDDTSGPKPPSAKSTILEVVSTVGKLALEVGDTATFSYTVKNISGAPLTLTTNSGCQFAPVLDQVEGPRIQDLLTLACTGQQTQTVRTMAIGETISYNVAILRGYDKNKTQAQQTPGYLLSTGTFDASTLVTANELPVPVRSDWVRFTVK